MELKKPLNEGESGSDSYSAKSFIKYYNQFIAFYNKQIAQIGSEPNKDIIGRRSSKSRKRRSTKQSDTSSRKSDKQINVKDSLLSISDVSDDIVIDCMIDGEQSKTNNIMIELQTLNPPVLEKIEGEEQKYAAKFHSIYRKPFTKILMVIIFSFVPIINIMLLGITFFYFLVLNQISKIHFRNLQKLSGKNPIEYFPFSIFNEEICAQMQKNFVFIHPKDRHSSSSDFTYNQNVMLKGENLVGSQQKIQKILVYNQKFYDSFHMLNKEKYQIAGWVLLGILLTSANCLMFITILFL